MNIPPTDPLRRPGSEEFVPYYAGYVGLVPDGDCIEFMESQIAGLQEIACRLAEADSLTVHPPYRWSIKQVVGHMIDAERIFADRIHRFSAGDQQAQPGMDPDPYVAAQDFCTPPLADLVAELVLCRRANLMLVRRIAADAWNRQGVASGNRFTVRALVWILGGHVEHHLRIIRQRLGWLPE